MKIILFLFLNDNKDKHTMVKYIRYAVFYKTPFIARSISVVVARPSLGHYRCLCAEVDTAVLTSGLTLKC